MHIYTHAYTYYTNTRQTAAGRHRRSPDRGAICRAERGSSPHPPCLPPCLPARPFSAPRPTATRYYSPSGGLCALQPLQINFRNAAKERLSPLSLSNSPIAAFS